MDGFILMCLVIALVFCAYWTGKFAGAKETFDYLKEEGRIIEKDELKEMVDKRNK